MFLQKTSRVACLAELQFLGRTLENYASALVARLGAEVDDVVGALYHIHVVFHHHYGVAVGDQGVESLQQAVYVVEVQARRVKEIANALRKIDLTNVPQDVPQDVPQEILSQLSERQIEILKMIMHNPKVTREEMSLKVKCVCLVQ